MRYFKSTFMWVIILAAIAGYSYIDFESTRLEEVRKDEATRLFPFFPKDVLAITLNKEEGSIDLERWEDGWRIVKPLEAQADSEAVEKFLGYITDSRNDADYVMETDPTPERLKEFGLGEPKLSVTMKVGKELKGYTLILGDRAPTMGVSFARLEGQKPVYRVLSYVRGEADKDVHYFRNKTVLRLNPVMIDQMSIIRKEGTILAKLPADGKWELEKPKKVRADHTKVFELLGVFANAEVKEFIAESKNQLAQYGLDKPAIEMLFWQAGDAEPTVRLSVGNRSPEKRGYFCAMSDRNNVFLLEEDAIQAIPRYGKELRSRELLFFEKDRLKRIEIRGSGKAMVLVKDIEKEWRRNNENGDKVEFQWVKELLDELMAAKIKDFITDDPKNLRFYGLDPPALQVLLWPEGSAVPINLSIGHKTPTGYVYARAGSDSSVLALDEHVRRILSNYL